MVAAIKLAIGFASFLANLLILAGVFIFAPGLTLPAAGAAVFLLGFSAGCVIGSTFKPQAPLAVGAGAFAAALILYTPLVLGTYGIALLGLPLLLLYAACVAAGAHMVWRSFVKRPHSS